MKRTQRRWAGVGLTCAVVAAGLSAFSTAPAWAVGDGQVVLRTGVLEVRASSAFPQVVQYIDRASGAVMRGNDSALTSIQINGTPQPVSVSSAQIDGSTVEYVLTPTALDGVRLTARLSVKKNVVTLKFTDIQDPGKKVATTL